MKRLGPIVCVWLWLGSPMVAFAYRPFTSTDAAVAAPGELELELGPVGFLKTDQERFLVAPSAILNIGIIRDWEIVLEGKHFILLDGPAGEARFRLVETALSLKGVLREGSLQGGPGPSVATEIGALLPTIEGEPGVGAIAALIVSHRSRPLVVHVNGAVAITRAHNPDLFGGLIVEGPPGWAVRPVVEGVVERELGVSLLMSALIGAIWRAKEHLSLDVGLRAGRFDGGNLFELRAGFTWAAELWGSR